MVVLEQNVYAADIKDLYDRITIWCTKDDSDLALSYEDFMILLKCLEVVMKGASK